MGSNGFDIREDHGPSGLQWIQKLSRSYGFSFHSDVRSVQGVIKDAIAAFYSGYSDEASLANLKESHAVMKADLEESLTVPKDKLANREHRIQKLENSKDIVDDFATKADEGQDVLRSSEEHVHFLEYKVFEQSYQFAEMDASSSVYPERVVVLEKSLANA